MLIAGTRFYQHGISSRKLQSHSISFPILSRAINLYSIVDLAIHVCFEDFHDTDPPLIVNIYPLVDFVSFVSDIKFASLNPLSIVRYLMQMQPCVRQSIIWSVS